MIRKYNNFILNEMSINDESVKKYKNVLQNLPDYKNTSNFLNELILKLKDSISNDSIEINKYDEDNNYYLYEIQYQPNSEYFINQIKKILSDSKELDVYDKYFNIVYPDGNKLKFEVEIEIEKNNLNRIHVPYGLPYILKGIGLGKKIYKMLIYELGYISSNYTDRAIESLYVWDSIRKDKEVFTFICYQKIISISPNLKFEEIEKILEKFFENLTDENILDENILLDNDFKNQYNSMILKSTILNPILEYEIRQDSKNAKQK
jgi:hypothetical protein